MANPAEAFFEADAKIEQVIYIPATFWDEEHQPDIVADEFLFGLPEEDDARLYKALPKLAEFREEEPEPWEIAAAFAGKTGFLVQAATPARSHLGSGAFYSGWGHYYTEWLYAATEADIARVVVEWAEERHASDKANAATQAEA